MQYLQSENVTEKHIEKVNDELGYEEKDRNLTNFGYAFYYNQLFINNMEIADADRYANLNTIIGYDIGINNFTDIDDYLWEEKGFDLLELNGCKKDRKIIEKVAEKLNIILDFSNWQNLKKVRYYIYSYFEDGREYK